MKSENDVSPVWRALSHPKRRQIVNLLKEKPHTTGELCHHFDVTRFAVMKHLKALEEADLILVRREGRQRWNVLNEAQLQQIPDWSQRRGPAPAAKTIVNEATVRSVHLEQQFVLPGTTESVFQALTQDVNAWWGHRRLGEQATIILEPAIGGRFYELEEVTNTALLLGHVTYFRPGEAIGFSGPMGVIEDPALSTVRLALSPAKDAGCRLRLHLALAGAVDETIVAGFRRQWQERLDQHLRALLEQRMAASSAPLSAIIVEAKE